MTSGSVSRHVMMDIQRRNASTYGLVPHDFKNHPMTNLCTVSRFSLYGLTIVFVCNESDTL